jgi:hypothetical protein
MAFTGDTRALEAFAAAVKALGSTVPEIAKRAALKLKDALDSEFARRVDPYEKRWKSLAASTRKNKRGGAGRMQTGAEVKAVGNTIVMTVPEPAEYHQGGTRKMPARPIFPKMNGELPSVYEAAIDAVAAEVISKNEKGM